MDKTVQIYVLYFLDIVLNALLLEMMILNMWVNVADGGKESINCNVLFPRDRQNKPVHFPVILQFQQANFRSWDSRWEVVLAEYEEPLACMEVTGTPLLTSVRSAAFGCGAVRSWEQTAVYPPFVPGNGLWGNVFSLFITSTNRSLSVDLNQRRDYAVIQRLTIPTATEHNNLQDLGIRKINMTHGGPKVTFPAVWLHGRCLGVADCYNGWVYLSLEPTDTAFLVYTPGRDLIEVRMSLSDCFPEYLIGVYRIPDSNPSAWSLVVRYWREGHYHSLKAMLDGTQTLFSATVEHRGRDCTGQWFLLGVKGAKIFPNCHTDNSSAHLSPPASTLDELSSSSVHLNSPASTLNELYALHLLLLISNVGVLC